MISAMVNKNDDKTLDITITFSKGAYSLIGRKQEDVQDILNAITRMDEEYLLSRLDVSRTVKAVSEDIDVHGNNIFYKGLKLFPSIAAKIQEVTLAGGDTTPFEKFLEKVTKNPSHESVKSLFEFLERHHLPITPSGNFIAYKGVRDDMESIHKGYGVVDEVVYVDSHLPNKVGSVVSMQRDMVDNNSSVGCSVGLHVGSYEYAVSFGSVLLECIVDPEHVVSVPNDLDYSKMRVHKYIVKGICEKKIDDIIVDVEPAAKEEEKEEKDVTLEVRLFLRDLISRSGNKSTLSRRGAEGLSGYDSLSEEAKEIVDDLVTSRESKRVYTYDIVKALSEYNN